MASIIKANKLQDFAGNELLTSDGSGNFTLQDKITTNNSALLKNTPAFSAIKSSQTTGQADATWTKITYDTELLDTDGKFSDGRFTPTVSGKYFVSLIATVGTSAASSVNQASISVY